MKTQPSFMADDQWESITQKTYITAGIVSQKAWDDGVLYDIAYAAYNMHLSEVSQNLTIM